MFTICMNFIEVNQPAQLNSIESWRFYPKLANTSISVNCKNGSTSAFLFEAFSAHSFVPSIQKPTLR